MEERSLVRSWIRDTVRNGVRNRFFIQLPYAGLRYGLAAVAGHKVLDAKDMRGPVPHQL